MKYLWLTFGWLFVLLGVIGVFLPLLPTTPFLLLAAICFSRGSQRLYTWLLDHAKLGPPIQEWHRHGAIATRIKTIAVIFMAASVGLSFLYQVPTYALLIQLLILSGVSIFILTRPAPPKEHGEDV